MVSGHRCPLLVEDEVCQNQFSSQQLCQEGRDVRHLLSPDRRVPGKLHGRQVQDQAEAATPVVRGRL